MNPSIIVRAKASELRYYASMSRIMELKVTAEQQERDAEALDACAAAFDEVHRLQTAIRTHRDMRGDDRCWLDDETLYKVLPEGYIPPTRDTAVELDACRQFIQSRHNPATVYISPQRRIEELESKIGHYGKLKK